MTHASLTPAMRQYMQAKAEVPADAILLFRMGDFYELFFDDAKRAAPLMDVVLTQRAGVPMCGVPYHALQMYVSRLLAAGAKVAIAEQMEDPRLAKGIVKRAVTRVITPGTVLDDQSLQPGRSNFLMAVLPDREQHGLALLDVSTGDFRAAQVASRAALETELHRFQPAECLLPQSVHAEWEKTGYPSAPPHLTWTPVEDWLFDREVATEALCRHFGVHSLDGFGCRDLPLGVGAAGAVLAYARNNLRQDAPHVTALRVYQADDYMVLDRISQRNLELVEPISADARQATLLSVLDSTITPMGSRRLREWILRPLRRSQEIGRRQDAVEALVGDPMLLGELRDCLKSVRDLERTIVRLTLGTANARDLLVLQRGLDSVPGLRALLEPLAVPLVRELREQLAELPDLVEHIGRAIVDEPPLGLREGGLIRAGYNEHLDTLRQAGSDGRNWIADLQEKEQQRTGIKSLKIRFNKVFGYYIEVTKSNLSMVPVDYLRKQTIVNGERFITPALKEMEDRILGAEEKSQALEYELFQALREQTVAHTPRIQATASAVASLDVLASLADTAVRYGYVRPHVVEEPVLDIRDGRHPVLDRLLQSERFVPNDTVLNTRDQQVAIITGPNMAGKSTYIRQVALLTILAQMGSFIPAAAATIGVADRVFTRVGAADDLSRGQSTFMVEMLETANILNNASASSLIILDEIGRGTSTFDGLSIAWAVAEYLHDHGAVKARTLFATHYHELTELALTKPGVKNYNVAVRENGDQIVFLRKIVPGGADQSYGIHVGQLAGLPRPVIERAREILANLEGNAISDTGQPKLAARSSRRRAKPEAPGQPTLFAL